MDLTAGDVFDVTLPYGTTTLPVVYEKNFQEQAVIVYNGGVNKPTTIVVSANHPDVADKVYTINPTVEKYSMTGKLTDLQFKGATVPNFQPDVYNYVVNVTAQPSAGDFVGTAFGGAEVTKSALDKKNKKITLTVAGGKVYTVSWFYTNCEPPFDMSGAWVSATKAGYKPSPEWKVPGDYTNGYSWNKFGVNLTYVSGKEVMPGGSNGVLLSTMRGASMNGSLPGMMTLGGMSINLSSSGGSSSSVTCSATAGIPFYNTPEWLMFEYKPLNHENVDTWNCWITMSDGTSYTKTIFSGGFEPLNVSQQKVVEISYANTTKAVSKMNILLNSCHTEDAGDMGYSWPKTTSNTSDIIMQDIHFAYNSFVKSASINGKNATVNNTNKTISITLAQEETAYPILEVVGQVSDQEQVVEWGEEKLVGNNMVILIIR